MPDTTSSVIVAGARTPMGRLLGSLKDLSGSDLGAIAIRGALAKAGVGPELVQYVIMGQVLTAGAGQIPARQAAVAAGIPMGVPALTINKVCLSGIAAIATADQLIRAGEFDVVVAGGQESMSRAPHLLTNSREGFKYGDTTLRDHMAYDGLHDIFTDQAMGNLTESKNQERGQRISREEQDAFAAASHQNAARAWKDGLFDDEVVPVSIPQRKGDPVVVAQDEGIRADTTVQTLARLRPAFSDRRHAHRGQRVADLRRCGGGGGDEPGQSRGVGPDLGSGDRGARGGGGSGFHAAVAAGAGDREGVCAGGARPEGFGSGGDQRGIRGGGDRIDARTRT